MDSEEITGRFAPKRKCNIMQVEFSSSSVVQCTPGGADANKSTSTLGRPHCEYSRSHNTKDAENRRGGCVCTRTVTDKEPRTMAR